MKDYYKILGVSEKADNNELKKAFRSLAKKYHPDRNKDDESAKLKFQEVNEAYGVLSKEKSRKEYDEKRAAFSNKKDNQGFKNTSKSSSKKENKSQADDRTKEEAMADLNNYFANFFGFDPKSNNMNKDKLKKQKNPIDTSNMFESFFNIKKK
ncbi:MAG: DnaJ domain-containing protein [Clostridium sp.]